MLKQLSFRLNFDYEASEKRVCSSVLGCGADRGFYHVWGLEICSDKRALARL